MTNLLIISYLSYLINIIYYINELEINKQLLVNTHV